jgi:hypothetical protein
MQNDMRDSAAARRILDEDYNGKKRNPNLETMEILLPCRKSLV